MPVVEELAKRFHVYALIMRFNGPTDELNADGTTNWARQWGKDLYDFCVKKGLKKFIHFGKCHGTIPGWFLVKEHPEMLDCFASFYLLPHVKGQTSNTWFDGLNQGLYPGLFYFDFLLSQCSLSHSRTGSSYTFKRAHAIRTARKKTPTATAMCV